MIVTLDGPSGAGKSTVARLVAKRLGFDFVDTGALYRALAWWIRSQGMNPEDERDLDKTCRQIELEVHWGSDGEMRVVCNGKEISEEIRNDDIGMLASRISTFRVVREKLWEIQRALGSQGSKVFEGRDMGSWVFPQADAKFFLTATVEERARRRFEQYRRAGQNVTFQEVLEALLQRDSQDSTRILAPLRIPEGAEVIDTTHLSPQEVVERILEAIEEIQSRRS